jgi:hypothetical protein
MSDIQRWNLVSWAHRYRSPHGLFVDYFDHLEAVKQAEQRGRDGLREQSRMDDWPVEKLLAHKQGREQGQRDALAAAVQRVEALPTAYGDQLIVRRSAIAAITGEVDTPQPQPIERINLDAPPPPDKVEDKA